MNNSFKTSWHINLEEYGFKGGLIALPNSLLSGKLIVGRWVGNRVVTTIK